MRGRGLFYLFFLIFVSFPHFRDLVYRQATGKSVQNHCDKSIVTKTNVEKTDGPFTVDPEAKRHIWGRVYPRQLQAVNL